MPTYIYRCEAGHEVEKFEPMSAPVEQPCPKCQECTDHEFCGMGECFDASPMRRQIGAGSGFSFKGGAPTRKFHRRG